MIKILKTDKIEIELHNNNVSHYRRLGYNIPMIKGSRGRITHDPSAKILVRVQDVPKGTHKVVLDVICDYCGIVYHPLVANYTRGHHMINKDSCPKCVPSKTREINILKYGTNKLNKISEIEGFKLGRKILDGDMVYQSFIDRGVIPIFNPDEYKNTHEDLPYICNNHIEKGILYRSYTSMYDLDCACKYCNIENGIKQQSFTYDYAKEVFDNKGYLLLAKDYKNCDTKMKYKCLKHNAYGEQECTLFSAMNYKNVAESPRFQSWDEGGSRR